MRFLIALISLFCCVSALAEPAIESPRLTADEIAAKKKISAQLSPELKDKARNIYANASEFLRDKEFEAAVIRFKQLLDIDPANGPAHYYLGEAYANLHDLKNAAQHYHEAIDFAPDSQEAVLAQVRLAKIEKPAEPAPAAPVTPVPASVPAPVIPASAVPATSAPATPAPAATPIAPASAVSAAEVPAAPAVVAPAPAALAAPASAVPATAS